MWLAPLKSGKRRDLLWQRKGLGLHGRLDANARTRFSKKKEKGEEKLGGLAIDDCGVLGELNENIVGGAGERRQYFPGSAKVFCMVTKQVQSWPKIN